MEGGENCVLHGDDKSENLLSEIVGAQAYQGQRHMNMETLYEYGSRSGFWRILRLFQEMKMAATVYAVGMALERNPDAAKAMVEGGLEGEAGIERSLPPFRQREFPSSLLRTLCPSSGAGGNDQIGSLPFE